MIWNPHLLCVYTSCRNYFLESFRQTLVASSTMWADFVAYYESTIQAIWLKNFISRLQVAKSIFESLKILWQLSVMFYYEISRDQVVLNILRLDILLAKIVIDVLIVMEHIGPEEMTSSSKSLLLMFFTSMWLK